MLRNISYYFLLICLLTIVFFLQTALAAPGNTESGKKLQPIVSLLLNSSATMEEKIPTLVFMTATGTEKLEMAWTPGSDGVTPNDQIQYNIGRGQA